VPWLRRLIAKGALLQLCCDLDRVDGGADVSFKELNGWKGEIIECEDIDPEFRNRYLNTRLETRAAEIVRFSDFIDRHQLWRQFLAEDAQGKR